MEKGRHRSVEILRSEYVTPESPTPTHPIWLCNLDLLINVKEYTPVVYLYPPLPDGKEDPSFFNAGKLKSSLAKALVPFYPFAGELRYDHHGRIEVLCTGKGVLFVEASCSCTMDEYGEFIPGATLLRHFFPDAVESVDPPCSVAFVQVTRFRCGGVCLGLVTHHHFADGVSVLLFLNAWAQITQGVDLDAIERPFLDRTLLKARSPPSVQYNHSNYDQNTDAARTTTVQPTATSVLRLTRAQVARLKGGVNTSTFSAVLAHTWRSVCKAKGFPRDMTTKVDVVSDIRNRVEPPLPKNFIGNAIVGNRVEAVVGEVIEGTINDKIDQLKHRLHDGHLRSLIDHLEVAKLTVMEHRPLPPADFVVASWLSLPFDMANFGWGKPVYVNRAVVTPNAFCISRDMAKKDEIMVTITLEEDCILQYEKIFYDDLNQVRLRSFL